MSERPLRLVKGRGITTYRRFAPELESIAAEWAEKAVSTDAWKDLGSFGGTESRPFRARRYRDGLVGLAKPGLRHEDDVPRAAHEKLAADLAEALDLPVPPVILWECDSGNEKRARYVSISAWAFGQSLLWNEAKEALCEDFEKQAAPIASAMHAFETWISAQDRKPDHVVVNIEKGEVQLAFIDYAFSMSRAWRQQHAGLGKCPPYLSVNVHLDVVAEMADKIRGLDDVLVDRLVARIPPDFLPQDKRELIMINLKERKKKIRFLLDLETKEAAK